MDALLAPVEDLMRTVAQDEIMSRFGLLKRHEINSKSHARDLVTTADLESEHRLAQGLSALLDDSTVVGEEDCFRNREILDRLTKPQPVWVVDPLDGTHNFSQGKPCFAVICALVVGGETQMGWILDPVSGVCATVLRGGGVRINGQRRVIDAPPQINQMTGSVGDGQRKRLQMTPPTKDFHRPQHLVRYHCCGREYIDMMVGKIHFVLYGGNLMPWDHCAGTLMVAEAGGYARMRDDKSPYDPTDKSTGRQLLLAPNEQTFETLDKILFSG